MVGLGKLDVIFPEIKLCSVTLFAFIKPFGVSSSPILRQVAKFLKDLLDTVDKLILEIKSNANSLRVPAKTEASFLLRVNDHREEIVHLELIKGNCELSEEHVVQIEVRFNLSLRLEVWHELELVIVQNGILGNRSLSIELLPLPTNS